MNIEIIREDNRLDTGMLHVFQLYDCWSAEEMKNLPCLRLAIRNTSGWLVVSVSMDFEFGCEARFNWIFRICFEERVAPR